MARKIIDISHKLTNERPQIKISEELTLTVDDTKNNVLKIMASMNSEENKTEAEFIDSLLVNLFGKEGKKKLEETDYSISSYMTIASAAMAVIMDMEVDDIDNMFRTQIEDTFK